MISIPFSGSKRYSYQPVKDIVQAGGYKTVYEPFGGSAVLSANLFNDGLIDKALINDFDHLFEIYPTYLDKKDEIIQKCLDQGFEKSNKKLDPEQQVFLQSLIKETDKELWPLLANNFVFSARITSGNIFLKDFVYFHNDITTKKQREYLEIINQLDIVSLDYVDYYKKAYFEKDALIILDPPYLNSAQKQYNNKEFFGLAETIDLLKLTKKTGLDFVFFNMVEKDTKALLELFDFNIAKTVLRNTSLNYSSKRDDFMAYIQR